MRKDGQDLLLPPKMEPKPWNPLGAVLGLSKAAGEEDEWMRDEDAPLSSSGTRETRLPMELEREARSRSSVSMPCEEGERRRVEDDDDEDG